MTLRESAQPGLRPSYLTDADDVPHEVPDVPLWSENYLSQAYSPANQIGIYMHHGTASFDVTLWNEILVVYLPGDRFLVAKGFARNGTATGPAGPALTYRCDKPFEQWTKTFSGAARLVPGDALRAGPMTDGEHVFLEMTLTYRGSSPAFDLGNIDEQNWGSSHYHQHCGVTGELTFDGQTLAFDGTGLRDHSWGPRDIGTLANHEWATVQFPSGRNFSTFTASNTDGTGIMAFANTGDFRSVRPLRIVEPIPAIKDLSQISDGYRTVFDDDGQRITLDAEILSAAPLGLAGRSELMIGADMRREAGMVLFVADAQARFTCDGEVGYGYTQRSFLL